MAVFATILASKQSITLPFLLSTLILIEKNQKAHFASVIASGMRLFALPDGNHVYKITYNGLH